MTDDVRVSVREGYASIAQGEDINDTGTCGPTAGCCAPAVNADQLAETIGYSTDELAALPGGSNLGLSCGNPLAIAGLQPGEVVVDLGSGAGFDCFLAGPKVGETGRVIGVDMTPAMLDKARANAAAYSERTGLNNVEFRLGEIEHLPLADNSVDVIMSNCVLNLSPDKPQVWREIARVLKDNGKVMASDMALFKPLPDEVAGLMNNWIGCVAGAQLLDDYRATIEGAGLTIARLDPKPEYVTALSQGDDPFYNRIRECLPEGEPMDYVTSVDVLAFKLAACAGGGCC